MTRFNKRIIGFMLFIGLMLGFSGMSEASTGSITDTFIDLSKISTSSQLDIDTTAGQIGLDISSSTHTYQGNTAGDDRDVDVWGSYWAGQTFTTDTAHTINGVNLRMYKSNTFPGTLYVDLRLTDAGGKPTGSNLASGSANANDFTTDTSGAWYGISFTTPYSLAASTQYAIVCHSTGNSVNKVLWRADSTGNYGGGMLVYSNNDGAWGSNPVWDCMFAEWGDAYYSSGNFVSANLLSGLGVGSIDSFDYDASLIPTGTSLKIQFSQDNSTWYDSSGLLGGWETLSEGNNTIDLSALGWSGENFYYKMEFNSDTLSTTSILDEISLNYTNVPEPMSFLLFGFGVAGISVLGRGKVKKRR